MRLNSCLSVCVCKCVCVCVACCMDVNMYVCEFVYIVCVHTTDSIVHECDHC